MTTIPLSLARQNISVKIHRVFRTATIFFFGQGALQFINILTSIFLVHTLSVERYAQFGFAFGFQTAVSGLMNVGYAGTIIPLVGENVADRELVGRYVRAAKHLRDRTFLWLAPLAGALLWAVMYHRHWPLTIQILLLIPALMSMYSAGPIAYYSAPLILYGRLRQYYLPQTAAAAIRLAGSAILYLISCLNAWTATAANAICLSLSALWLGKECRQHIKWPIHNDGLAEREIFNYVLPAIPAITFGAFQPQLALFLITLFGQTINIAQVAALNRLGQIFLIFTTFNTVIVEPYTARLPRGRLLSIYLRNISLAVMCCIPLVALAFKLPQPLLWLLGANYAGLGREVGWVILAACISYLAGLIWIMNRSRKWVFWSGTLVEIGLVVGGQITYLCVIGVRNTHDAIMISVLSSLCYLTAHTYVALVGFLGRPRGALKISSSPA